MQHHPTVPARALLVEPRGENGALVQARLVRVRRREGQRRRHTDAAQGAGIGRQAAAHVGRTLRRTAVGRPRLVDHLGRRQEIRRPARRIERPRPGLVATVTLVRHRAERGARPGGGTQGRRPYRHRTPRNQLHRTGGAGCRARRDLLYRDLRRDDRTRLDADVPAGARHQVDGHQDGALGRGCRRGFRRLPLFPQGARRPCLPRGNRAQDQ